MLCSFRFRDAVCIILPNGPHGVKRSGLRGGGRGKPPTAWRWPMGGRWRPDGPGGSEGVRVAQAASGIAPVAPRGPAMMGMGAGCEQVVHRPPTETARLSTNWVDAARLPQYNVVLRPKVIRQGLLIVVGEEKYPGQGPSLMEGYAAVQELGLSRPCRPHIWAVCSALNVSLTMAVSAVGRGGGVCGSISGVDGIRAYAALPIWPGRGSMTRSGRAGRLSRRSP